MNEELKHKLQVEINKSGFSHEMNVIKILRENDLLVFPNLSFIDSEDHLHEIDVFSMLEGKNYTDKWKYGNVYLNLIIECKASSERPWVFFEDSNDFRTIMGMVDKLFVLSNLKLQNPYALLTGCTNTDLGNHHYNDHSLPVARTYFEAFGKDSGKDIYQAITTILFTLDYYNRRFIHLIENKKTNSFITEMFHLVIVFKGIMVSAIRDGENYTVEEVPHVILRIMDCITDKSNESFRFDNEKIIDVVREDYLDEYIKLCNKDLELFICHLEEISNTGWLYV
jgi:hypothetical protein